jgi:hypothetical protein
MLFPIIVPRRYNKDGRWVGPLKNLKHPNLAITWAVLNEPSSMTYVSHAMAREFLEKGIDFEKEAMENLQRSAEVQLFTHEKEINDELLYVITMQRDGLGSSRLLLLDKWASVFPNGFYLGLPERSCAIVVSSRITPKDRRNVVKYVDSCFRYGNTTMLPSLHSPKLFTFEESNLISS